MGEVKMKIVKPKINKPLLQDINICLKNNEFYNVNFTKAEFLKVNLNNIDFSTCNINSIVIDISSLKGIIISNWQCCEIVSIFGVKTKN